MTFQTQVGAENAAKWGVKGYVIEVWDGDGRQWKVVVEENRGRTMKNRVHKLATPVRTERFRVIPIRHRLRKRPMRAAAPFKAGLLAATVPC